MKQRILATVLIAGLLVIGGYRLYVHLSQESVVKTLVPVPVEVMTVYKETVENTITYEGRISPEFMEKISFKSTARLVTMAGEIGEILPEGQLLASLDTKDLDLAYAAAAKQQAAAEAEYRRALNGTGAEDMNLAAISVEKAEEAVVYLEDKLVDMSVLLAEGQVSQSEYDSIELELTLAQKDLALAKTTYDKAEAGTEDEVIDAARAQAELAAVNVALQQSLIDDSAYVTPMPVVLVKKMYEPGELVPAGYPAAVVRSLSQEMIIGVTAKDLGLISVGQKAMISSRGISGSGTVSRVAEIPDEEHFLYEVAVDLGKGDYIVGDIGTCDLILGKKEVLLVPITAVQNDGIDYVYVAEEGRAVVRKVVIDNIYEDMVAVSGLLEGEQVIISNLNRLKAQSEISTKEEL